MYLIYIIYQIRSIISDNIQGEVKGLKRLNKLSDLLESEVEAASAGHNTVGDWSAWSLDTCSSNCIFPFTYKGQTYHKCTKAKSTYNWCATAVIISGSSDTPDYYGRSWYSKCASDCPAARMDKAEEEEEVINTDKYDFI